MAECSHDCANCSSKCSQAIPKDKLNEFSSVKHVIGVVSGKGGVGKSIVTSMLAVLMQRKGYKTAILDADITGPSIPSNFGPTWFGMRLTICLLICLQEREMYH